MKIHDLTHRIDREHEERAQYPNPVGTPNRHRIRKLRFKFNKRDESPYDSEEITEMAKSVEGKKAVEAKAKETKPAKPETWGSKEMASKLGIDAKRLRTIMRAAGKGVAAEGGEVGRYEWKPNDEKAIAQVKKMVDEFEAKAKARADKKAADEAAAAKKAAAKKENGKPAKKSKKAAKEEDEDEEVFEEEGEEATE